MANVVINDANLVAIGDAIRAKNGTANTYKPREMANAITNLPTGGGGADIEPIVITGSQNYGCSGPVAGYFIEELNPPISTSNLTDATGMFFRSTVKRIPFSLNFKAGTTASLENAFMEAKKLERPPEINNCKPSSINKLFYDCERLKEIPENFIDSWDFSQLQKSSTSYAISLFSACYSLRTVPSVVLNQLRTASTASYNNFYVRTFESDYNLDEICDWVVAPLTLTSNVFVNTFLTCICLKRMTFETNPDGTPKTAQWKKQTLDLSSNVGFYDRSNNLLSMYPRDSTVYDSGRTINDAIYDDTTYQKNKNNPNAYVVCYRDETKAYYYSLYNHTSAVETINSLPDCSAYCGTDMNTIKFKGEAGSATDGGAINTLTEEEIAIATAKGWTITLV